MCYCNVQFIWKVGLPLQKINMHVDRGRQIIFIVELITCISIAKPQQRTLASFHS